MTAEEHKDYVSRITTETNLTAASAMLFTVWTDGPFLQFCACIAVSVFVVLFGHFKLRAAQKRYEQALHEYIKQGGVVVFHRENRRRWRVLPMFRTQTDLSEWEDIYRREGS